MDEHPGSRRLHVGGDNLGQMVAGNVYANQLLFNVGGETFTAAELPMEALLELKKALRRARHRRNFFASFPLLLWGMPSFLVFLLLMQAAPPHNGVDVFKVVVTTAIFAVMFWMGVLSIVGASPRIQRGVAGQLEERLILLQLEIDLRERSDQRWPWRRMWAEWRDVIKD